MDPKVFIPVYGPYMEYKRIHESDEPFAQKAYDAAFVGTVVFTEMAFAFQHAAHLGAIGEGSAFSLAAVKRMQNLSFGTGAAVTAAVIGAGVFGQATAPRADVEHKPYGSVKVTPSLFGGFY